MSCACRLRRAPIRRSRIRAHKVKKQQPSPPPLPSGPQGPVPQIPLDAIPAVAPQVTYQDGLLTIVAPNSTLADILRGVRKHTSADIEIPATASERVVTRLGPGPAREVMAELLNGSRFNYILLGSPEDANALVRVVLVAKTGPDTPAPERGGRQERQPPPRLPTLRMPPMPMLRMTPPTILRPGHRGGRTTATAPPDQPGVKTPQQLLQEMQQRQLQMQQQQDGQAILRRRVRQFRNDHPPQQPDQQPTDQHA